MVYLELFKNVAILVSLVVIHGHIIRRWNTNTFSSQALSGFLFGGVALTGMLPASTAEHSLPLRNKRILCYF